MGKIREALNTIYLKQRKSGMTQKKIAEFLKCKQGFVSEMLNGEKRMTDEVIEGMCRVMNVSLSDLDTASTNSFQCSHANHIDAHDMLETILKADANAADWITGNLVMFNRGLDNPSGGTPTKRKKFTAKAPINTATDEAGPVAEESQIKRKRK